MINDSIVGGTFLQKKWQSSVFFTQTTALWNTDIALSNFSVEYSLDMERVYSSKNRLCKVPYFNLKCLAGCLIGFVIVVILFFQWE